MTTDDNDHGILTDVPPRLVEAEALRQMMEAAVAAGLTNCYGTIPGDGSTASYATSTR